MVFSILQMYSDIDVQLWVLEAPPEVWLPNESPNLGDEHDTTQSVQSHDIIRE